jgi:hypothetical protein
MNLLLGWRKYLFFAQRQRFCGNTLAISLGDFFLKIAPLRDFAPKNSLVYTILKGHQKFFCEKRRKVGKKYFFG